MHICVYYCYEHFSYHYRLECDAQTKSVVMIDYSRFEEILPFMRTCWTVFKLNSFPQMPRIWIDYCKFLVDQKKITRIRRTFDRALRALPITQHHRIWPLYVDFVKKYPIHETAVRVYRRMLKVIWVRRPRLVLKLPVTIWYTLLFSDDLRLKLASSFLRLFFQPQITPVSVFLNAGLGTCHYVVFCFLATVLNGLFVKCYSYCLKMPRVI